MKNFDFDGSDIRESLDFRELFSSASPSEIEAACLYEYMRESRMLRDAINGRTEDERKEKAYGLKTPFFLGFKEEQFFRLMLTLQEASFPRPWKALPKLPQAQLVSLIAKSMRRDKQLYRTVVIEEASVELDHCGETADQWYHWRLEPAEPSLLKRWEQSGQNCFFGFIRIDQDVSQSDACNAFRDWFEKRSVKHSKGNLHFDGKLNQLTAMRARHYYARGERGAILFKTTGKKTYERNPDNDSCTDKADIGLSRDCQAAKTFFRTLFPDEEPINWPPYKA